MRQAVFQMKARKPRLHCPSLLRSRIRFRYLDVTIRRVIPIFRHVRQNQPALKDIVLQPEAGRRQVFDRAAAPAPGHSEASGGVQEQQRGRQLNAHVPVKSGGSNHAGRRTRSRVEFGFGG